jgi:SAM-dependent methyltransferase
MNTNHWNERYSGTDRLFTDRPDETMVELAADLPTGRALDVGAGEGRNSLWLVRKGWIVTAIDVSEVALTRLADQARDEHLSIATEVVDMIEYLERGERFDLVVIANIHVEPGERDKLFAEASNSLTPGGHLFLVGHHLSSLGKAGPSKPEQLYTEEMLKESFPKLELLRVELRKGHHGDRGIPTTDVYLWALCPLKNCRKSGFIKTMGKT